ncbi:magnesium/cobalt transporter CorA [Flavobacterium gilvum]|uniref:Magnesium transport protein CorA n=1 Tax=Flavobacterium gilvum TaxID=1492737 RepID=A0AAC9I5B5_9FLAO|nr:magnesium/cobalt transporter CorA [Flavobacterium gilvum]AOW10714.1 magnesium and cobalt transport protein CorA [Flavobacterium gilvum]KFC60294.1 magnesium transporter [Flavobacterium gilvum]
MRKIRNIKTKQLQPYNLEYTGLHTDKKVEIQLFVYDDCSVAEYENDIISDLRKHIDLNKTNWLNIHGLNNIALLKVVTKYFNIDNFILSDILNTNKRTKLMEEKETLFFNIKSLLPQESSDDIRVEQISFLLKKGILISFQEKRSDFFTHIRERIRTNSGIVRTKKADYLLYILLDTVIGNFYITLENEEDKIEELIDFTKSSADPIILEKIEKHRDNFNLLKRSIIPLRDSLYDIKSMKDDDVFDEIEHDNYSFFTRLYQKCLELLEQIESDMGLLESASNFFFAAQAHKMNEIMKTLTVISVIFIPLTFIVGVYGMNFDNMPELKYHNGYFLVVCFMFMVVIAMVVYFKKRRWF